MKYLGISGSLIYPKNHDASAALVVDGKLVGVYEEERFNRVKHSENNPFPYISISKLLSENNLKLDDIDAIGIPYNNQSKDEYAKMVANAIDENCTKIPQLVYKDHHMAHICEVVYQSGFDECACLIIDGMGDSRDGVTLAEYKNGNIQIIDKINAMSSLGIMYSCASSDILNLGEFSEGKLMGLSSYGVPTEPMPLYWDGQTIKNKFPQYMDTDNINMYEFYKYEQIFTSYFKKNCYPFNEFDSENDDNIMYYINFSASIQNTYENIVLELVKHLKTKVNTDNLVLSGGCIQNCIANNKIIESKIFENVFASPIPHDAGCSIGLAFQCAYENNENIINNRTKNSYVGKQYSDDEILSVCDCVQVEEYIEEKIAKELCSDKIFAWFQGGSELGPRALGHRSLIANPSSRSNMLKLNNNLKHRESWRPLAPSVPSELFNMIFDTDNHDMCEFMLRTLTIKENMRKKLIGVCHVDNTTRPQYLEKEQNEQFYNLIMKFYKLSGCPCIINTSFNDKHQPIIETPEEAIEYLMTHTDLEGIIFNSKYVVRRKNA